MKINSTNGYPFQKGKLLKIIMRTFLFLCLTSVFSFAPNNTFSQKAKIKIDADKTISVAQIFELIQEQAGYKFVYSDDLINNAPKVRLKKGIILAKELIKKGLSPIGCTFEFTENETVIVKRDTNLSLAQVNRDLNQQLTITGNVQDANGQPLPGASIVEKGTTNGATTDFDGNYSITLGGDDATLIFSYLGFTTKEVIVNTQTLIDVQLSPDSAKLDEVVIIGYGSANKRNLTGAIGSLKAQELEDQPVTSFDQGLAGRLPGVDISQTGGAPGGGVSVNIRGVSSISGGTSPLYVIDGVPLSSSTGSTFAQGQSTEGSFDTTYSLNPLSTINPSDIESVQVLKDAAAAAIYGSRGSNGVVLITTKQGRQGEKPTVSFNTYAGFQRVDNKIDIMNAQEHAEYTKLARDNSWIAKDPINNLASDPQNIRSAQDRYAPYLLPYLDGGDTSSLTDTDWQDQIFRNALIQNYELSVRGGTTKTNYFVSGSYFDQEGVVINSGLKRYSARLNLNTEISDKVRFGINLNPSYTDHNIANTERNWWKEGLIITALNYHPNLEPRNPDGSFRLGEMIQTNNAGESVVAVIENPLALAELIDNTLTHTRILGNTFAELDLHKNLTFKTSLGVDISFFDRAYYRPKVLNWRSETAPTSNFNYAWTNNSSSFNWLVENTITYDKTINENHNLNVLLGQSAQKERNRRQYTDGRNFPNDNVRTLNGAQTTSGFTEEIQSSLLSYFGRASYNYKDKYLLSASIRHDGSSRFGANTKWGTFPSVSGGWRISDEEFWSDNATINQFKLRASYGETGNTEIPFFGGAALLGDASYVFDDGVSTGLAPVSSPNPDLSWETTKTFDVGIDFSLFDNQINISADYYKSNTEDLLLNVAVPSSTGFVSSLQNIGELENKGFEFIISTSQNFGDLTWNGSFNISTNDNKIVSLGPGQDQFLTNSGLNDPAFILQVGESIGSFYGYRVDGIFENQAQFDSTPHLEGQNQGVGDFIYADTDGDGDVDPDDRTILGNSNPDFSWGFTSDFKYKELDLSFNLVGKHGAEIFNATHRYLAETWGNSLAVYLSDDAPRPVWGIGTNSHTRPSSWHVEDASFIRLRNITLGYSLPEKMLTNNFLSKVRVYVSALNAFTITDYSGYNPEVSNQGDAVRSGEDFGNYPSTKSFTVGLNVSF